jgi:hypothetical protein
MCGINIRKQVATGPILRWYPFKAYVQFRIILKCFQYGIKKGLQVLVSSYLIYLQRV